MKYVAAFMLAALSGEPTKAAVTKIVTAHGGEADSAKIDALFTELEGKSLDELIAAGTVFCVEFSKSLFSYCGLARLESNLFLGCIVVLIYSINN
jgi:ribosomal protein L12E/L44/L45/RPP1/RPP2